MGLAQAEISPAQGPGIQRLWTSQGRIGPKSTGGKHVKGFNCHEEDPNGASVTTADLQGRFLGVELGWDGKGHLLGGSKHKLAHDELV